MEKIKNYCISSTTTITTTIITTTKISLLLPRSARNSFNHKATRQDNKKKDKIRAQARYKFEHSANQWIVF